MGLIMEGKKFAILSDILGDEDHLGDMDFKVCGTADGVTAFQMDLKIGGIPREVMEQALEQAREGRLHILEKMNAVLSAPRADMSKYAPRIHVIKIRPEKVREVIGSGGKVIRGIIEQTGVKIDIEDDGSIHIASTDEESAKKAIGIIEGIVEEAEIGKIYEGRVTRIAEFGAFVEIIPGTDGLVHISELAHQRVRRVEDVLKEGDMVKVKCLDVDHQGKIRLSRKALLERDAEPEASTSREAGGTPKRQPEPDSDEDLPEDDIGLLDINRPRLERDVAPPRRPEGNFRREEPSFRDEQPRFTRDSRDSRDEDMSERDAREDRDSRRGSTGGRGQFRTDRPGPRSDRGDRGGNDRGPRGPRSGGGGGRSRMSGGQDRDRGGNDRGPRGPRSGGGGDRGPRGGGRDRHDRDRAPSYDRDRGPERERPEPRYGRDGNRIHGNRDERVERMEQLDRVDRIDRNEWTGGVDRLDKGGLFGAEKEGRDFRERSDREPRESREPRFPRFRRRDEDE
jgi:polyribonucleotide nucleotidyltransferase